MNTMTFVKKTYFYVPESPENEFACRFELAAPGLNITAFYITREPLRVLYRSRQLGRDRLPRPVLSLKQALL